VNSVLQWPEELWSNILLTNTFLKATSSLARFPLSVFLDTKLIQTKRDGRIIGGTNAKEGEFPWMVR